MLCNMSQSQKGRFDSLTYKHAPFHPVVICVEVCRCVLGGRVCVFVFVCVTGIDDFMSVKFSAIGSFAPSI